ncbi:DUF6538 domain-containing protein [Labrys sp. 22185]|uniref:DUF6538 domain-containing protein n=1 Tax=Labrys sp. 22185 TaxID=3453888 RepID=UPI003F8557C8
MANSRNGITWRGKRDNGPKRAFLKVRVPTDVAAAAGKQFIQEALGTSDPKEAARLAAHRLAQLRDEWKAYREHQLTPDDFRRIGAAFYTREIEQDRKRRATYADAVEIDAIKLPPAQTDSDEALDDDALAFLDALIQPEQDADDRQETLAALRSGLRTGRPALLSQLSAKLSVETRRSLADAKLAVTDNAPEFREARDTIRRAWIASLETAIERDAGNFGHQPADEIVIPPPAAPKIKGDDVMSLWAIYERQNPNKVATDTLTYSRRAIEQFAQCQPKGFIAQQIDKAAVRRWHDILVEMPVKASETKEFKGLTPSQTVARNKVMEAPKPAISTKTVNKSLSALGSFCVWLIKRGTIDTANPVEGFYHAKPESTVRAYSSAELTSLFSSPAFIGCLGDDKLSQNIKPGDLKIRDERFWLPLVSLFSGARLGELAQLLIDDVRIEHGRHVFFITPEGDASKTLKTKQSARIVPVHRELERLGFIAHWQSMKDKGETRLFPDIERNDQNRIGGGFSRWYGRYATAIGLKSDRTVNFHSFRHSFIDACRSADFLDSEFAFAVGHARSGTKTTRGYGSISEGTINRACEIVDAVSYTGLDLKHLYAQ